MMHLQRKYIDCFENCSDEALHLFQVVCHDVTEPWYRKHGKKHGPCFPMLCKSTGKAWKAWEYFQATSAEHGISMETMEHHLLIILNSLEKHGKHGALFSHDFRQHGKAWESMGSMVTPYFHHFK